MTAQPFDPDCPRKVTTERIPPVRMKRRRDGNWFVDFGRAAFARPSLRLSSTTARTVVVHLGEVSAGTDRIERDPGGSRRYRAIRLKLRPGTHGYLVRIPPDQRNTGPLAIPMPRHVGEVLPFRYLELEDYASSLQPDDVRQVAAFYPFDEADSDFHSSSRILDDVFDFCRYTMKATNFTGLFVDGDRERIPYEADAYINQLGWYCTSPDPAPVRATLEHLMTNGTWFQEWQQHMPLMGWEDYLYTGDDRLLREYYTPLGEKTLHRLARPDGLIDSTSPHLTYDLLHKIGHARATPDDDPREVLKPIVDWPQGGLFGLPDYAGETDGFVFQPVNTVVNAFACHAMGAMARIARTIGKPRDADRWAERAKTTTRRLNRVLLDRKRGVYRDGEGTDHASLHANMFPLAFGLVPPKHLDSVADFVVSRGMACSVYGSHHLLDALYHARRGEAARKLLSRTGERSWAHMLYTTGSTIALEAWEDKFKPNQDWNHAWGAAPAAQIPRVLMGVRPTTPGFRSVRIAPRPGRLRNAELKLPTPLGPLNVRFQQTFGKRFDLDLDLPEGMDAEVHLPRLGEGRSVRLDRRTVTARPAADRLAVADLTGRHALSATA